MVSIPRSEAPSAYVRDVLERGHLPGVLSGKEDARRDVWRERMRHQAMQLAERYGVAVRRTPLGELLWMDQGTGQAVRVLVN